jgi:N-acyl homoserine lactone hydrolase
MASITPIFVADLLAEGERMPVYVHLIDHPDARVLVDTGIEELHPDTVWVTHEHEPWRADR